MPSHSNINTLNIANSGTSDFLESILTENFIPHLTLPIKITENSITLIDHILIKIDRHNIDEQIISGNLINDISDHLPNIVLFGNHKTGSEQKNRKYVRIYSENNINMFKYYLEDEYLWTDLQMLDDCDKAYECYIHKIKTLFDKCFPFKLLSRKRSRDKKWITAAVKKSCATKNKLYKQYLRKPTENNHRKYKRYKNVLQKVCQEAQVNYFNNLVDRSKQSIRKLWQTFGPVINPASSRKSRKNINKLMIYNTVTENIYYC